MANVMQDLWPKDIGEEINLVTPLSIMREQANLLTEKTQGLIMGEIKTTSSNNNYIYHRFLLNVPILDYRYELFFVYHPAIRLYPVNIMYSQKSCEAIDQNQFISALKVVLSDENTINIIHSLIAQAKE